MVAIEHNDYSLIKLLLLQLLTMALAFLSFRIFELGDNLARFELGIVSLFFFSAFTIFALPALITKPKYRMGLLSGFIIAAGFWGLARYHSPLVLGYSYDVVSTDSNIPTMLIGDLVISKHFGFQISRGAFIGFNVVNHPALRKRVVAIEGDKVFSCNDQVFVQTVDHPLTPAQLNASLSEIHCEGIKPIIINEGEYFVLGDNYSNSFDSRHFGSVSEEDIFAKSMFLLSQDLSNEIRL